MKWLARIFTWWHGQTLNTALHTLLFGKFVGKDEYGNRYYRTRKIDKALGFERRWVIERGQLGFVLRCRAEVLVEPPVGGAPSLGTLLARLPRKIFAQQRVSVQHEQRAGRVPVHR